MMIQTKNKLATIVHPLVATMYLKKEFGSPYSKQNQDILVIETNFPVGENEPKKFSAYLNELLSDLPAIQDEVVARAGSFDRVHLRTTQ